MRRLAVVGDARSTEKAGFQEHFIDLCRLLGEPTPHAADPIGSQYAFEKRVDKAGGRRRIRRRLEARLLRLGVQRQGQGPRTLLGVNLNLG